MKSKLAFSLVVLVIGGGLSSRTVAQSTTFTFQGRLTENGLPVTGSYDFRFRLASDAVANNFIGLPILTNSVPVAGGLFAVMLDFGPVFAASNYWLDIGLRPVGGGTYTMLTPRQAVTPARPLFRIVSCRGRRFLP